jgi:hypothetical protein
MFQLSPDPCFNFELLRILAHASYSSGADVGEVLLAASEIEAGNFESWYRAFHKRAERVLLSATTTGTTPTPTTTHTSSKKGFRDPVSVRDANFRAATYFRAADFFLHGDWNDERINDLWKK